MGSYSTSSRRFGSPVVPWSIRLGWPSRPRGRGGSPCSGSVGRRSSSRYDHRHRTVPGGAECLGAVTRTRLGKTCICGRAQRPSARSAEANADDARTSVCTGLRRRSCACDGGRCCGLTKCWPYRRGKRRGSAARCEWISALERVKLGFGPHHLRHSVAHAVRCARDRISRLDLPSSRSRPVRTKRANGGRPYQSG